MSTQSTVVEWRFPYDEFIARLGIPAGFKFKWVTDRYLAREICVQVVPEDEAASE